MTEPTRARILIADDEPLYLQTTATLLRKAGYDCVTATDGDAALTEIAAQAFDLVLSDLNMPGNRNLELLERQRQDWPGVPLIVITGAPSLPTAIESVRLGIADYLLKPVRFQDLLKSVERALARARHSDAVPSTRELLTPERAFPEIIGDSPAIHELKGILAKVVKTDSNVLITGESGTGKEVVAKSIHQHGRRSGEPFQVIDCTAIPEGLFESMLFGHAKGAFTGAVRDQPGLLSEADGGVVFFDEIGELPLLSQSKLLRLIQEQTFTPVGKSVPIHFDVRFISATNRDLELEVNAGRFRRDLFYRLAVIHLELPALSRRGQDVLLLARYFLHQLQPEERRVNDFSPEASELLVKHSWPGNIRELRNVVEHGVAMASSDVVLPGDLPKSFGRPVEDLPGPDAEQRSPIPAGNPTLKDVEREFLVAALRNHRGNVSRAAQEVGMSRQGLHKRLRKAGIDAAQFR